MEGGSDTDQPNSAAVHVGDVSVQAEALLTGQVLRREGLVALNPLVLTDLAAVSAHQVL